jgi:hypothetical protein
MRTLSQRMPAGEPVGGPFQLSLSPYLLLCTLQQSNKLRIIIQRYQQSQNEDKNSPWSIALELLVKNVLGRGADLLLDDHARTTASVAEITPRRASRIPSVKGIRIPCIENVLKKTLPGLPKASRPRYYLLLREPRKRARNAVRAT